MTTMNLAEPSRPTDSSSSRAPVSTGPVYRPAASDLGGPLNETALEAGELAGGELPAEAKTDLNEPAMPAAAVPIGAPPAAAAAPGASASRPEALVGLAALMEASAGSPAVRVAVIDGPVDRTHAALA